MEQNLPPYMTSTYWVPFSFKGTTRQPRFGNPTPRIAECPAGMLNAVGLQNPGIDHVLAYELPQMKQYFHKPVMANVSGFPWRIMWRCAGGWTEKNRWAGWR